MEDTGCLTGEEPSDRPSNAGSEDNRGIPLSVKDDGPTGILAYDCYNYVKKKLFPPNIKKESKELVKLAWGTSLNSFIAFFIPVSTVLIVGHKGKDYIAAIGLGISVCNVTGNVVVVGLTSATETFCSQAFGAGHYKRIGIVMQKSLILTFLAVLPSCALWINMDKALLFLGQDKDISLLAGSFGICYIPGLLLYILFNILTRYLACQQIIHPTVYGALLAFVINGVFCYLFVYVWNLGVWSAAFALDLSYLSFCVFTMAYIYLKKIHHKTWHGWSKECLFQWKEFIFIAAPTLSMTLMEWIVYEVGIITIGIIGSLDQAALIVTYYLGGLIFFVSFGISIGTSVRVGMFLGAGKPECAKTSLKVSIMVTVIFTTSVGLLVIALKDVIGLIFTSDREVVGIVSTVIIATAAQQILDGMQVVANGAVRGMGYQKYGALINFIGYICIGIPVYLVLMFKARLGALGFWLGATVGVFVQIVFLGVLLCKLDWSKLSRLARERVCVASDTIVDSDEQRVGPGDYGSAVVSRQETNNDDVAESSFVDDEHSRLSPRVLLRDGKAGSQISLHADDPDILFTYRQTNTSHSKLELVVKASVLFLLFSLLIVSLIFKVSSS